MPNYIENDVSNINIKKRAEHWVMLLAKLLFMDK